MAVTRPKDNEWDTDRDSALRSDIALKLIEDQPYAWGASKKKFGANAGNGISYPGAGQNGGLPTYATGAVPEDDSSGEKQPYTEFMKPLQTGTTGFADEPTDIGSTPSYAADPQAALPRPPEDFIGTDEAGLPQPPEDFLSPGTAETQAGITQKDLLYTASFFQSLPRDKQQNYLDGLRAKYPTAVYENMVGQLGITDTTEWGLYQEDLTAPEDMKPSGYGTPLEPIEEHLYEEKDPKTGAQPISGGEVQVHTGATGATEEFKTPTVAAEGEVGREPFNDAVDKETVFNQITTLDPDALTQYLENWAEVPEPEAPLYTIGPGEEVQLVLGESLSSEGIETTAWGYYKTVEGDFIFVPVTQSGQVAGADYTVKLRLWQNLQDFRQRVLLAVDTDARRSILEQEAMRLGSELNISEAQVRSKLAKEGITLEAELASTRQSNQAYIDYLQVTGGKAPVDEAFGEFSGKDFGEGTLDREERRAAASQLLSVFMQQGGMIPDDGELFGELAGTKLVGAQFAAKDLTLEQTQLQADLSQEGALTASVIQRIFEVGGRLPDDEKRFGVLAGTEVVGSREFATKEREAAETERTEEREAAQVEEQEADQRAEDRRLDREWLDRVLEQGTDLAVGKGERIPDDKDRFGEFAGMYIPGKRKYKEELATLAWQREMKDTAIRLGISSATTQAGIDEAVQMRKDAELLDRTKVAIDILSRISSDPIFLRHIQQSDMLTQLGQELGYDFGFMSQGPGDLAALGQVGDLIHLSDFEAMPVDQRSTYLYDLSAQINVQPGEIRGEIIRRAQGGGLGAGLAGRRTERRVVGAR
jgi:hypothetical protein